MACNFKPYYNFRKQNKYNDHHKTREEWTAHFIDVLYFSERTRNIIKTNLSHFPVLIERSEPGSKEDMLGQDTLELRFINGEWVRVIVDEKCMTSAFGCPYYSFAFEGLQNEFKPGHREDGLDMLPGWFTSSNKINDFIRTIWVLKCSGKSDKNKDDIKYEDIEEIIFLL